VQHGGRYGNQHKATGTEGDKWPLKIAQYVMWLTQNRQVRRGERFLMDAPATPWHENLRVSSAGGIILCQAVAESIRHAAERDGCTDILAIVPKDNAVYVRLDMFERFVERQYPRFRSQVSGALARLSTVKTRIRWPECGKMVQNQHRFRVHALDIQAVIQTLHQQGYDADFRKEFGKNMWQAVLPDHLRGEYKDPDETPPPPPPLQLPTPPPPSDPQGTAGNGGDAGTVWSRWLGRTEAAC
jgi:hypothetical protein